MSVLRVFRCGILRRLLGDHLRDCTRSKWPAVGSSRHAALCIKAVATSQTAPPARLLPHKRDLTALVVTRRTCWAFGRVEPRGAR